MQHLRELLKVKNSELAQELRFALRGLRATLQKTLAEVPLDPGASRCKELLKELDDLLELTTVQQEQQNQKTVLPPSTADDSRLADVFDPVPQQDSLPVLSSTEELKLSRLRQEFISNQELLFYLGNDENSSTIPLQSTTDRDLWNKIQRFLLRVPESLANSWRERSQMLAQEAGTSADNFKLVELPFSRNELIYPGLNGTGTVPASGLCWSASAPLDPRLTEGTLEGDLKFLADVVSTCLKFIELDSSLHHALKRVYRFGIQSLDSKPERDNYIATLIDCFQRAQAAEKTSEPVITLRTRLDLDEAVHSLVYLPPATRDSWWGKLQQESRRTLKNVAERARQAGCTVQIRALWGPFATVRDASRDNLPLKSGGKPGEVLACLRVYAKINEEVLPGRVLFRSLR